MPAIKPLDKVTKTWAKRAAAARDEYKDGVENPRKDWEAETVAAVTRMVAGFDQAAADGRIERGISDAGTRKWQQRASSVGPGRFSEGVRGAEPEYRAGFSRYHSRIAATDLPPRGPAGSPENLERVRIMAEALHDEKVSG